MSRSTRRAGSAQGAAGDGSKSERAFRTISEVAEEIDVPQHVLRFWETRFSQLKPMKRGGGRRYYRPEDVALLQRIRTLLYEEGYTIKGVQKVLRSGGAGKATSSPAEQEKAAETASIPVPLKVPELPALAGGEIARLRAVREELMQLRRTLLEG